MLIHKWTLFRPVYYAARLLLVPTLVRVEPCAMSTSSPAADKQEAANLIKQMREGGLLSDGSVDLGAVPKFQETAPQLFAPSWGAPDAVVRAPSSSIRPASGVMSADSFKDTDDGDDGDEAPRGILCESGSESVDGSATSLDLQASESVPVGAAELNGEASNPSRMARVSIPPPVGAEEDKEHIFVWVNIDVKKLDSIDDREVMIMIHRRNQGETDGVPEWLLEGLKDLKGPVDWLLKVRVPAGIRRGQRLALMCNGVKVKTTYNGQKASEGERSVFAVQEREAKPSIGKRLTKGLASVMRRRSASAE